MATIKIGDRDLEVKHCTMKMWRDVWIPYRKDVDPMTTATPDGELELYSRVMLLFMEFIGHNKDMTLDWLYEHVSHPPPIDALLIACGMRQKKDPGSGEAASQ